MEKLENDAFYQLLRSAQDCPGILLGEVSLWALDNFVTGYLMACRTFAPDSFPLRWHDAFFRYVCKRFQIYREGSTVFSVLRQAGYDGSEGVAAYFDLLRQFAEERFPVQGREAPEPLQSGEVRAFRLAQDKVADFAGNYAREHSETFFGAPDGGGDGAYEFVLSEDGGMTCALWSKDAWAKRPKGPPRDLPLFRDLPAFSMDDAVRHTAFFLSEEGIQ